MARVIGRRHPPQSRPEGCRGNPADGGRGAEWDRGAGRGDKGDGRIGEGGHLQGQEFNLVSIYEARALKVMGMSMKCLGWITVGFTTPDVEILVTTGSAVYILGVGVCRGNVIAPETAVVIADNPLVFVRDERGCYHRWSALLVGHGFSLESPAAGKKALTQSVIALSSGKCVRVSRLDSPIANLDCLPLLRPDFCRQRLVWKPAERWLGNQTTAHIWIKSPPNRGT